MHRLLPTVGANANVLIRHLLMPGHVDCCTRPVLEWLSSHLPEALINLMTGYKPFQLAGSRSPMGGGLKESEVAEGLALAKTTGLRFIVDGRSGFGSHDKL
jgi:putative pyruvate formate lyase activating enzyme